MKRIMTAIVTLLLIATPVLATTQYCLDNITLQKTWNYTINIDSEPTTLDINREVDCQFGCDNVTHSCAPNPVQLNYVFGGGILALLFIIAGIVRIYRRM